MGTDKNGILTVTAFDCTSGKETSVTFENKSTNLSLEAILEMKKKATEMREIDRKIAEKLRLYNEIEAKVYSVKSLYDDTRIVWIRPLERVWSNSWTAFRRF